ncbi:hypothetical protein BV25DRAFT_1837368 [Artomyces pyxidatus]|uniref:Uncharacterized protein n=1 Tax=Artomyces pyxidatus TaxID=48021 RepID=A0ACB8T5V5_9AGAM|nr:hypothetical protein BV25DRAFT_1837368 [Artomyces pyxidatus]
MHSSSSVVALLLIAAAASPAVAAPIRAREADDFEARSFVSTLEGIVGKEGVPLLKSLGTGLLGGGAVAGLDHVTSGSSSSSSSSRREFDELAARSFISSIFGATKDPLSTVLKTSAAAGLASGAVASAGGELEKLFGGQKEPGSSKRSFLSSLGPIEKGLIGTVTSLGVSGAASGALDKLFGGDKSSSSSSRREFMDELDARSFVSTLEGIVGKEGVPLLKSLGTGLLGGGAVAGLDHVTSGSSSSSSSSRRDFDELEARSFLSSILGATEEDLPTVLKNAGAVGLASGAVASAGGELEKVFGGKKLPGSSRSFLSSLGPIEKGLIGTVTSLGVSGAASGALDKLFGGDKSSSSSSRREFMDELDARSFVSTLEGIVGKEGVPLLKSLGTGLLGGGAIAGLDHATKSSSSSSSSRRDFDELEARSFLSSILGATEEDLPTVLKNAGAVGLASGAVASAGGELEKVFGGKKLPGSSRSFLSSLGPIEKGLIGTVTSLGVSGAASGVLDKVFGSDDKSSSSRRALSPEQLLAGLILSAREFDDLD